MRWGVRDEATDDHQTVDLCGREIRNCQRMSLGPNFVALIGDKYGFRPLCNRIKSSEYRALRRCLIELDMSTDFLDTWYKEDLNAVPAEYLLQPISSILKNFTNKAEPELQSIDQRIWQAIQERIHELLLIGSGRLVAQGRLSEQEQSMRYSISVTEREVIEGCLDVKDAKQRCLIYVRSIRDLRDHLQLCLDSLATFTATNSEPSLSVKKQQQQSLAPTSNGDETTIARTESDVPASGQNNQEALDGHRRRGRCRPDLEPRRASLKIGTDSINLTTSQSQNAAERKVERTRKLLGRYVDLLADNNVWKLDHGAQVALQALKERKLSEKLRLGGKNLNKFDINWHDQEGVSLKSEEHKRYLNELTEHFYMVLSSMIRKSAKRSQQQQLKSSGLLDEVLQHSHYACHVSKGFAGRTRELAHLRAYIVGEQQSWDGRRPPLPMFVHGVGGSGKTSFLARAATLISDWLHQQREEEGEGGANRTTMSQSPCVISRFCGTTPSSSSMVGVLGSVCRQLQYNFYQFGSLGGTNEDPAAPGAKHPDAQLPFGPIPDDLVRLVFSFRQLLANCSHKLHRERLFVIILDSLEHLSSPADRCSVEVKYSWLTSLGQLPPNVRLIVSCSSESETTWRGDFAHLKGHFLRSYFDLEHRSAEGSRDTRDAACTRKSIQHLEQRLVKTSSAAIMSPAERRFRALRLITTSSMRFTRTKSEQAGAVGQSLSASIGRPKQERACCWIIHIRPLGSEWARRVLQNWLKEAGRNLTQQQWSIVEKSFACCSRPIFIKLAFGEVINWKSFSMQSDTHDLTFGSSLLEKQRPKSSPDEHNQDRLRGPLSQLTMAQTATDEPFRWQIIHMEQEWLNYLESQLRREEILERRNMDSSTQVKANQMTIRINGGTLGDKLKSAPTSSSSSFSSICHLSSTIDDAICQLLARIEIQHGFLLTRHSLSYLTAARNGICENELEDLLSLDDIVLDDVFQYHLPPVRRIPPLLWARIRGDLPDYLSERDTDGSFVINWHHEQFREATQRRYLCEKSPDSRQQIVYIHSMMADYFLGKWADKPKPFKCTKQQALMAAEQLESAIQQSLRDSQSLGRRGSGIHSDRSHSPGAARLSFGSTAGLGGSRALGGSSISVHNRLRNGSNQNDQRFQWMQAKADRRVPHQPLCFAASQVADSDGVKPVAQANSPKRYNLRKLAELPYHLVRAGRFADLASEVLFNYKWLFCSLDALGLQNVLSDFDDATRAISGAIAELRSLAPAAVSVAISPADRLEDAEDQVEVTDHRHREGDLQFHCNLLRQIDLLGSAIRLSCGFITRGQTHMLAPQLIGRLLPVLLDETNEPATTKHLAQLLEQCDRDGCLDNALLPLAHCLQSPEGLQSSSLEGHSFAVMAMALTNDRRHLLAVSNKFIMWDIARGEVSRVIEPKLEGSIMRGLRLSADNKYAFAYTSNNLILLLDILTQQVVTYRGLASSHEADPEPIEGLELIDKRGGRHCIVWTKTKWLMLRVAGANRNSPARLGSTTATDRQSLLVKLEFCAHLREFNNLSEPNRRIEFLRTCNEADNSDEYLVVIGTRLDRPDGMFRISTFGVARELGAWNLELWSDRIDNVCAFSLNESLSQLFFVDSQTNCLYLKRRRRFCWSKAKRLPTGTPGEPNLRPVLSLQISCWPPQVIGNKPLIGRRQDNGLMDDQLRAFERSVDSFFGQATSEHIQSCSVFDTASNEQQESTNGGQSVAIVMLHETSVTVVQLGAEKLCSCHLKLPKEVRNVQVEPNRCQMDSLVVRNEQEAGAEKRSYLILSFNRRLLFYLLHQNGHEATLMDSAEAHGARIVQLLPIGGNREEFLVATASMDKSVKLWNLSNLARNSPSLDKLDSPIQSIYVAHQSDRSNWAVCLSRNECAIFDWQSLKLVKRVPVAGGSQLVRAGLSSNGRYLCLATLDSLRIHTLQGVSVRRPGDKNLSLADIDSFELYDLRGGRGLVRKITFFQQDSRMLATVVCFGCAAADPEPSSSGVCRRIMVLCFSIPDGRLVYSVDHLAPLLSSRQPKERGQPDHHSFGDKTHSGDVRLPILTRNHAHIVTVEFGGPMSDCSSSGPLQLNVYGSRDGKLAHSINLSELPVSQQQASSRGTDSLAHESITPLDRRPLVKGRCTSISADQFSKLKAIQYLDRQSVVALIEPSKGLAFIVDLHSRQLILGTSAWNGKRLTSDGRYGLCGGGSSQSAATNFHGHPSVQFRAGTEASGASEAHQSSLLQLLEMRHGTPIRSLLAANQVGASNAPGARGSTSSSSLSGEPMASWANDILCGFNWPNDSYVHYCDQGRRRILLVRLDDGQLVANYRLPTRLVSLKWADDGLVLLAGLEDGSLLSLAIVDANKGDSALLRLAQYPSRRKRIT